MGLINAINNRRIKKVLCVFALILVMACVIVPSVFADDVDLNFAEKASTTILDNIFWVILIVAGVLLAGSFIKRNVVGAIIIIVSAGVISIFLKNPTLIQDIGTAIGKIIGLA